MASINTYYVNWAHLILSKLGLKVTPNRMQFLYAWMAQENTGAKNNPLATTWDMSRVDPGQTNWNYNSGYPVKQYSSQSIGLQATINTLLQPAYYKEIKRYLQQDISLASYSVQLATDLAVWGSGAAVFNVWKQLSPDIKKKLAQGSAIGLGAIVAVLAIVFRKQIAKIITK